MDLRKLKKLIDLVEESGITELEVTEGEEKVRIVKHPAAIKHQQNRPNTLAVPQTDAENEGQRENDDFSESETIKASMVGTFYRSASPETAPFIEIGSAIKEGQILGVIETMKQLNEIEADCDGIVKAILVDNGQAVEYGTPLFVIE